MEQHSKQEQATRRQPMGPGKATASHSTSFRQKLASVFLSVALVGALVPLSAAAASSEGSAAPGTELAYSDKMPETSQNVPESQAQNSDTAAANDDLGSDNANDGQDSPSLPLEDDASAAREDAEGASAGGSGGDAANVGARADAEGGADKAQQPATAKRYVLHIAHVFRFTAEGKNRHVTASQDVELTADDFTDGVLDVSRFACDAEQVSVTRAKAVSLDSFNEDGEGGAEIVYQVASGWKIVPKKSASTQGTALRGVFTGSGLDDYVFVPANVVRFTLKYVYSNTGALAGMDVTDSQRVEAVPQKQDDGTYVVEWDLPTKEGFRIVMDPAPLNAYLVKPPTGSETPEEAEAALDRGDYAIDADKHTVYYYQEAAGASEHPVYKNQYSTEYNAAWDKARTLTIGGSTGFVAEAVCGNPDPDAHPAGTEKHGASALADPKMRLILTESQLESVVNGTSQLDTVTVNYRRNATAYTVNHWVPESALSASEMPADTVKKTVDGTTYVRLSQDTVQGRVGALTKAQPKASGDNPVYGLLAPKAFSQKIIETDTVVDLYYEAISAVRVIFNTNYTYIPRQQVKIGDSIVFSGFNNPTRTGYRFAGWQYDKANGSGREDIAGGTAPSNVKIDSDFLKKAKLETVDGASVLNLYPKWDPAKTQVRVVLWTEDLAGGNDDVQAIASGGNPAYYNTKYAGYGGAVKTHKPTLGENNADTYSNVGSFVVEVPTDSALVKDGALVASVQDEVNAKFAEKMKEGELATDVFYAQDSFEVNTGSNGVSVPTTTATADGKTTIYVYYTRNVYELKFHYYGEATDVHDAGLSSNYAVATQTDGFSYAPGGTEGFLSGDVLNFSYQNPEYNAATGANDYARNQWKVAADALNNGNDPVPSAVDGMADAKMTTPQTIVIRAKYGADLRDVWPVARPEEVQFTAAPRYSGNGVGSDGQHLRMISWATTAGAYNEAARDNVASGHDAEPTIMGTYGTMGSEIIADPQHPEVTHHLVAYWNDMAVNYYTNNHCFELPDLDLNSPDVVTTSIAADGDTSKLQNCLYLVPRDSAAITKYGFTDLMPVSYEGGTIQWDRPDGKYYAVRQYNGTCYGVARRVQTVSTAGINNQNPSARAHMTRANAVPDHNTQFDATQSENLNTAYGVASDKSDNPYQLYFYYNRDRYTITYMVPSNVTNAVKPEYQLGQITLPYGAMVSQQKYGFSLDCKDRNDTQLNGANKYPWDMSAPETDPQQPVCPDRHADGTKVWTFRGWALGPSGANMQWSEATRPVGDAFAIQGNMRLYAMWNVPTYTVEFDYAGGTEANSQQTSLTQTIPANTRYSASGIVPRPLRAGYTFQGWYVKNADGTASDTVFNFDQAISKDQSVVAKWSKTDPKFYNYTVFYVTKTLADPLAAGGYGTVTLKNAEGRDETWYVLEKSEHRQQEYAGNITLNIPAKAFAGYIPQDTNQALDIVGEGDYAEYVRYVPTRLANYTVRYVTAGTEGTASPHVVLSYRTSADQVVTTPDGEQSRNLVRIGYELVSRQPDGTYVAASKADELTWINAHGEVKGADTLSGVAIPETVTYLVRPIVYTVQYRNAPGSPAAAQGALEDVTAPAGTFVADAGGANPTQYVTTDAFPVKNPGRVQQDGTWYRFSHWSLGNDTTLASGARAAATFEELSVEPGTVGHLTFVANWVAEEDPKDPGDADDPNDPSNGGGEGDDGSESNGGNGGSGDGSDADGSGKGALDTLLAQTSDALSWLSWLVAAVAAAGVALVARARAARERRLARYRGRW